MQSLDPKQPSRGLGDSIAKFTHATGIDKLATKVAQALGQEDCGCERRRETLNNLVPYNSPRPTQMYELLEDVCIEDSGRDIQYNKGDKVLVGPALAIYYHIDKLLQDNKIKLYATERE